MINKKLLNKIYERVNVEKFLEHYHVRISGKNGPWLRMPCILPSHKDTSPSANLNTETGFYKCFVCGNRSFYTLVKELENLPSFGAAVEFVKKKVGFESDTSHIEFMLEELNDLQNEEFENVDEVKIIDVDISKFESALDYYHIVKKRVDDKMIQYWDLKYATSGFYKNRLIIPITYKGRTVSFCARDMSGRAEKWLKLLKRAKKDHLTVSEIDELRDKYECKKIIYPPVIVDEPRDIIYGSSISALMFNFDKAIDWNKDYIILVEGAFDAMRLFSWGFNAVAILGTKLSRFNRSRILENYDKVYICLDNDEKEDDSNPGQESAMKIYDSLKDKLDVYNILLPPGKDPDDCTVDEFEECFRNAKENFS